MEFLNFHHLRYFWTVARKGGVRRAAEELGVSQPSISAQLKLLEEALGEKLFRRGGRNLVLTEAGQVVLSYADEIFSAGRELMNAVKQRPGTRALRLTVGMTDAVSKLLAFEILRPAFDFPQQTQVICRQAEIGPLIHQLQAHRLDLVLADEAMGKQTSVKAFNHTLGTTAMTFFVAPALKSALKGAFPGCLDGAPMLIQGSSSAMRQRLDLWLAQHGLRPRFIGEFDDAALLKAFGSEGRGVFMSPSVLEEETCAQYGVRVLGHAPELVEEFFAISVERRISHPCVAAITHAARVKFLRK